MEENKKQFSQLWDKAEPKKAAELKETSAEKETKAKGGKKDELPTFDDGGLSNGGSN